MDRLVKADVKEVEIAYERSQNGSATFRITNLMHTMSVAISLSITNPSVFSFSQPFSTIPPLSSSSYTVVLSDQPPLSASADAITVKSSMLPTGKAHQDELRRLFSRPGPHVFRDATIPVYLVGPQAAEYIISNHTKIPDVSCFFNRAICGCTGTQITGLLRSAVLSGDLNLVTNLIDHGGDVNCKDSDGRSLISLAVQAGHIVAVQVLIASGCVIDGSIDKVLHYAAAINRVDLMEVLCASFEDIDVNSVDSCGRTPIHVAASRGHVEVARFCVSAGGKTEVLDCDGSSSLHLAAEKGHLEITEYLLDCSYCYIKHVVNREGKTPFSIAVDNGHSHLYDLLHIGDALQRAARLNDVNGVKSCLAEGAKVNRSDQNGWTPLHRAAFKGKLETAQVLLDHGAQVDAIDDAGYTPLHCAVEAGHMQVALLLIAHGARAEARSLDGAVPLNIIPSLVKPLCQDETKSETESFSKDSPPLIQMASDSSSTLSFNTMVHLLTIKLSSSNFLLWRSQVLPVLQCQHLLGYVDGSIKPPSATTGSGDSATANPEFAKWQQTDQLTLSLLLTSLTEEAMAAVVGLTSSHAVWSTLETTFSHRSKSRELRFKDELQHMKKDSRSVVEYSREFKTVCDQLAAMGRPVDDLDKIHWYLRGLGSAFSTFSTTQLSLPSLPSFTEIVPMAESYENFIKSLELPPTGSTSAAFTAYHSNKFVSARGGNRPSRGGRGRGHGRFQRNRPIRCQICREEGHYATSCHDRYSHSSKSANLVESFTQASDWYTDTGATAHMTNDVAQLDKSDMYTGKDCVVVGNGATLPISHTESSHRKGGGNRAT